MVSVSGLLTIVSFICFFLVFVGMLMSSYWGIRLWHYLWKNYYPGFFTLFGLNYRLRQDMALTYFIKTHPEDETYNKLRPQYRLWMAITLLSLLVAFLFTYLRSLL